MKETPPSMNSFATACIHIPSLAKLSERERDVRLYEAAKAAVATTAP